MKSSPRQLNNGLQWQGLALLDAGRWYVLGYALAVLTFMGVRTLALVADCACNVRASVGLKVLTGSLT